VSLYLAILIFNDISAVSHQRVQGNSGASIARERGWIKLNGSLNVRELASYPPNGGAVAVHAA
jgi:hypothetical protein